MDGQMQKGLRGEQEVATEHGGGFKRLKLISRPPQLSKVFGELKCAVWGERRERGYFSVILIQTI